MTDVRPSDPSTPRPEPDSDFGAGAPWPIPPAALAALVDMGMSDEAIGRYFRIPASAVRQSRGDTPA